MLKTLKPIETHYKGHRFRSRLEARWAVYFDALQLEWDYEPEGYVLPSGTAYLPDFCVQTPQGEDMWIEVKPSNCTSDSKFEEFKKTLNDPESNDFDWYVRAYLVSGTPLQLLKRFPYVCHRCGAFEHWESCDYCDWETPTGSGHPIETDGVLGMAYQPSKGSLFFTNRASEERWHSILNTAATKAQSARFEHGQQG